MKKIVLLLVSGLLILSMAGSAMAWPYDAFLWNEAGTGAASVPIQLAPGQSITLSYHGENIDSRAFGAALPYSYTIEPNDPAQDNPDDIVVTFSHRDFTPTASISTDAGVITVTNVKGRVGASYLVTISAGDNGIEFGTASRRIDSIPEFPTVALPIAALIGLIFVFGRKKEGL